MNGADRINDLEKKFALLKRDIFWTKAIASAAALIVLAGLGYTKFWAIPVEVAKQLPEDIKKQVSDDAAYIRDHRNDVEKMNGRESEILELIDAITLEKLEADGDETRVVINRGQVVIRNPQFSEPQRNRMLFDCRGNATAI